MQRSTVFNSPPIPQHLLNTNIEPSPQEVSIICRPVFAMRNQMAEEWKDQEHFHGIQARRRHAVSATFVHNHIAILSAVRRVPPDIWENIFLFLTYISVEAGTSVATYRIRLVCRLWNSIAKKVPELLATIPSRKSTKARTRSSYGLSVERAVAAIPDTYLLAIHISTPVTVGTDGLDIDIKTAFAYSPRYKTFSIVFNSPAAIRHVTIALYGGVYRLCKLQIHVDNRAQAYLGQLDAFGDAPSLTNLEISVTGSVPLRLSLPWRQLKLYKERSFGEPVGLTRLLADKAAIERIEYWGGDPAALKNIPSSRRQTLVKLSSIDVRLYGNSASGSPFWFLDRFTAPCMKSIKMKDHGNHVFASLLEFLDRSCCRSSLTALILDTGHIKSGVLTSILRETPALTTLECNDIPYGDLCMLSVRKTREGSFTLVPLLHDLVIHSASSSQLTTLEALAERRSGVHAGQKHFDHGERISTPTTELDQAFSLKLAYSGYHSCEDASKILFGPQDPLFDIRCSVSDTLAELDIQVDEIKVGQQQHRRNRTRIVLASLFPSFSSRKIHARKLNKIILYLEDAPVENMPEITRWGCHVMNRFRALDAALVPENSGYNFLNRANNLYYSWVEFRRSQILKTNWMLHGRLCLIHAVELTSTKSSLMTKPESVHDKYQIEEDCHILWADYDLGPEHTPIGDYIKWRRSVNMVGPSYRRVPLPSEA